jgi:chloramphenicol 3-O-phosphotransferase
VISGCVDTAAVARSYVDALAGAKVTMCRLRADAEVVRSRAVHRGSPAGLVDDVAREVAALDATDFADHVVDTTGLSVAEVVAEVRKVWP